MTGRIRTRIIRRAKRKDYLKELEDDGNLEEDGEGPENSSDG